MPSIRDLYPDTYLKASHLRGKKVTVEVEAVYIKDFWNDREQENQPAFVVRMVGKKLPFILNKTQTFAIAGILRTEDYTRWAGGTICLGPGKARGKDTIVVTAPEGVASVAINPIAQHPDAETDEPHPDGEDDDDLTE